tara:strand:+ start:74 stop:463 length:390 start_codon:yes stop_codon:yes gene_type:complete
MGKSGLMALVDTRPELKKYFTKKGTLRKQIGKPKLNIGIEFVIYAKISQISKGRKLTMWKAWEQLTNHRNFAALMKPHFQKMKKYKIGPERSAWRKLINDPDWKKNFYKNHLKKSQLIKRLKKIKFTYE